MQPSPPSPEPAVPTATSAKKLTLKMRVYRAKEDRWHDLPEQVYTLEGEPK